MEELNTHTGYIDMHNHILPAVDDGAKSMTETKKMLEIMYEQGVRTILVTPHNYPNQPQKSSEELRNLALQVEWEAKKISEEIQIYTGNEILYRETIPEEIEQGRILTLADSQYILVEFLPEEHYTRILHGVKKLVEYGYCPVIAHVERLYALHENVDRIQEIIGCGAYLQVNAGSLQGGMFHKQSNYLCKLVAKGYIHFLGSDCHNTTSRPPIMEGAVKKLRKKVPKESLDKLLYDNPRKLLEKQYI